MSLSRASLQRVRGAAALLIAATLTLVAVAPARAAKIEEGQQAVGLKGTDFLTGARSISSSRSASA